MTPPKHETALPAAGVNPVLLSTALPTEATTGAPRMDHPPRENPKSGLARLHLSHAFFVPATSTHLCGRKRKKEPEQVSPINLLNLPFPHYFFIVLDE